MAGWLTAPAAIAASESLSPQAKKMAQREARRELATLKKYDANANGVLDPQELATKQADAKAKRDAGVLKKYDANGNGALDPDEVAKQQADAKAKHDAAVLKKYDKNANGVLDPDEAAANQANVEKMRALREAKAKKAAERAQSAAPTPASLAK
ncbi:MAG TPA: hypothetical protein VHE61_16030 [Opitutaceae bacterium]|nr:hypothetical protein [Opitutaceae bacterium]